MTKHFQYILDRSSRKHICPNCGKRRFVRYVQADNGQYTLPVEFGRCDRVNSCGYWRKPKNDPQNAKDVALSPPPVPVDPDCIPFRHVRASLQKYDVNNLVNYLQTIIPPETLYKVLTRYLIGTSRTGATIFFQVDTINRCRTGKLIQYNQATGHRLKDIPPGWVHRKINKREFNLKQCLFGMHLIKGLVPGSPVGIVESEKTAIICACLFPEITWLATGGMHNLKPELFQGLERYRIYLFPDLGGFDVWERKAVIIRHAIPGIMIKISSYLEENATEAEKAAGLDLADYLTAKKKLSFANNGKGSNFNKLFN